MLLVENCWPTRSCWPELNKFQLSNLLYAVRLCPRKIIQELFCLIVLLPEALLGMPLTIPTINI